MGMAFTVPRKRNISATDVAAVFGGEPKGHNASYIGPAEVLRAKPLGFGVAEAEHVRKAHPTMPTEREIAREGGFANFVAKRAKARGRGLFATGKSAVQAVMEDPLGAAWSVVNPMNTVRGVVDAERRYKDAVRRGDFGGAVNAAAGGPGNAVTAMFLGPAAKTADRVALGTAEKMRAAGAPREDIWNKTGWFWGADGKPRFEIDDSASRYKPDTYPTELSGMFDHPSLYQAYPELARMKASQERMNAPGLDLRGYYAPDENRLAVNDLLGTKNGRSTVAHEVQHKIQEIEGFADGGNHTMYRDQGSAESARNVLSWRRELETLRAQHPGMSWDEADALTRESYSNLGIADWVPHEYVRAAAMSPSLNIDSLERQVKLYGLDRRSKPYSPEEMYKRIAGEVEARNTQKRLDYTPRMREAIVPWESQDFPDDEQIVHHLQRTSSHRPR